MKELCISSSASSEGQPALQVHFEGALQNVEHDLSDAGCLLVCSSIFWIACGKGKCIIFAPV